MFFPIAEHRSTSAGTRSSEGLRAHGLLKVRQLGIEAIVSLSGPARRNDKKNYWNYVRGLAKEAGVDAEDPTQWPLSTSPARAANVTTPVIPTPGSVPPRMELAT